MSKNTSKSRLWTARIMSGFVILYMLFGSILSFLKPAPVVEETLKLGYSDHHILVIGSLSLLSTILYAFPRTSVLGAVLLTGYFGGATAAHIRMDAPLFTQTLFPVYFAVLTWGGIWLRDENVRRLFPYTKKRAEKNNLEL